VDGAIHRAAGPQLLEHNRKLGGCPTGSAKITPPFDLAAQGVRHIIHTVGPVWHRSDDARGIPIGELREDVLLASCYECSLELCLRHEVSTVAFPAISTGVYRFPKQRAAAIAVGRPTRWFAEHSLPARVIFCCFADSDARIYREAISAL